MRQDLQLALVKAAKRNGATTAYAALVGNADGSVSLPAAANAAKFAGFELYDCADGDVKSVHVDGGIGMAVASAAINRWDRLQIADAQGRVQSLAPQESQVDAGVAIAANAATLTQKAKHAIAVLVTAGTVSGAFTLIPRGVAPTVTKTCSLSADGTKVNFLAADAVVTASVEYQPLDSVDNIIAIALEPAAAQGDIIPVLIARQQQA